MGISPFIYGKTVSKDSFADRTAEAAKLAQNLMGGINTIIISPRRWGKSSLVEKVAGDIQAQQNNIKVSIIDLFCTNREEEFLEIYAREIIKSSAEKWESWVKGSKNFFKMLIPKISIGNDPNSDFSLSFDWKELQQHWSEILDLPERIALKKKIRFVICLDEFQNIAVFPGYENFEKKLRATWQRHKLVTYCLFGSKKHMLSEVFNNPSKPFYRFGHIMLLSKIETSEWKDFIISGFKNSGKKITEGLAEKIAVVMKNHSWYVQQLAHYTWNLTDQTATTREVEMALHELIRANVPLYQKEIENLSNTQVNLLKAIAKRQNRLTSAAVMEEYRLGTPRNVTLNKTVLVKKDLIQDTEGYFEFVDPAFELWFNSFYLNIPWSNLFCDQYFGMID